MIPGNGGQLTKKLVKRVQHWNEVEALGPASWAFDEAAEEAKGTRVLCRGAGREMRSAWDLPVQPVGAWST